MAVIVSRFRPSANAPMLALRAFPKCCSSSTTSSARSLNLTPFPANVCVPITIDTVPPASSFLMARASAAVVNPRQQPNLDAEWRKTSTEGLKMLPGEHRRGDRDCNLLAREYSRRCCAQRDFGLSISDVAADQPIHRVI